jgi:PRTRC genetic system protein F
MANLCTASGKRIGTAIPGLPGIATGTGIAPAAVKMRRPPTFPAWTLPRLSPDIPLAVVPRRLAAANAAIARFLIQAGAIREADVPDVWDDALEVCQHALDAWVKRELGTLHCLSPHFCLTALGDADPYAPLRTNAPATAQTRYRCVEICWFESGERQWVIGPRLEALERECPGAGRAALDILQGQASHVYPVFTPDLACHQASFLYWCGEEDEEAVLDMDCGDDAEERNAMRADMVTRQNLNEAFPAWVTSLTSKRSSVVSFRRLASRLHDPHLRDIAADALALAQLRFQGNYLSDVEGEYLGWGAVLSWREDDLTVRIYDDMVNMAHQGEFCDRIGELIVGLDEPQTMQSWRKAMHIRFKAMRLIDRLIHQLSDGY